MSPETAAPSTRVSRIAYRIGRALGRTQTSIERVPAWLVLGGLVLLNWGIAAEIGRIAQHDGPLYNHGGDATSYYTTAWMLGHGIIPLASIGYGYQLLIAPIAALAGPNLLAGMPGIIVFNQLVLAPIAILCIYGIARLVGGRLFSYLATLLWVVFPVLVIHYFLADYHFRWVDITLPSLVGLIPLGDFPSMVICLVAAYFTLRLASSGRDADALAAGFAAGIAVAVKPANLLFLPAPILTLLVVRRFRGLGLLAAATLPSLLGTAVWKERGLGTLPVLHGAQGRVLIASVALALAAHIPLNVGRYVHIDWGGLHRNLDGLREYTWSQRMIYFGALGGVVGLARRSTATAVLAGTWLASYLIVKGGRSDIYGGGFFTHLIAALPAYFVLLMSLPFLLPFYGRRENAPAPPRSSRLPRVAACVLGVVSIGGALTVGLLPTSTTARAADDQSLNLIVPLDTFPLSAKEKQGVVTLSWPQQPDHGARITYAVLRSRPADGTDCLHMAGASGTCSFAGALAGWTHQGMHSFSDRPPTGAWIYRVGLSASPVGTQGPLDLTMLSRPVRVLVHAPAPAH